MIFLNFSIMAERFRENEALGRMPEIDGSIGKIWRRCAFAAAFIYGVMNWGQYNKNDKDLSAMEPDRRAALAANDVDIWREEPFYWQAAFLGSYSGALKHDIREQKRESTE